MRQKQWNGMRQISPLRGSASDCLQTEKLHHWLEIAIVVEQHMAARDAERPDDDIDRLADRMAPASQQAVIRRRLHSQFGVEQRHSLEPPQPTLDQSRFPSDRNPCRTSHM